MSKNKILIISVGSILALICATFLYAKFALFPRQWEAGVFFKYKEKSLDAFVNELMKHEDFRRVSILGDEVWVYKSETDVRFKITGEPADRFRVLIEDMGIPIHWKIDGGVLVHLTSSTKFGKHFEMAFIWQEDGDRGRKCELSLLQEKSGGCQIVLNENWRLNYVWFPVRPEM